MNTVRMGVIALCAAGVCGYLQLRGPATDETQPAQAPRAQAGDFAANEPAIGRSEEPAPQVRTLNTVPEPAFEPDTSDMTQPSQTFDVVLEAFNADICPEGEYDDREALAAVLRSDPELATLLQD